MNGINIFAMEKVKTELTAEDDWKEVEFNIHCKMNGRNARCFLELLDTMQRLGNIGSSRWVGMYADGDGNFRPKFDLPKWDFPKQINLKDDEGNLQPAVWSRSGNPRNCLNLGELGGSSDDGYFYDPDIL